MMRFMLSCLLIFASAFPSWCLERPDVEFKVFQFPPDMIPRIDGDPTDWDMVPDSYTIGMDQLQDTVGNHEINLRDKDVRVKVGWVKGMNRLYFLFQSYDDYWDFARDSLQNDIFELVVDGDLSGGPFIKQMNPNRGLVGDNALHFTFHGVQAQNYHIFTPPGEKDWCMVWGAAQWMKDLPWANHAYSMDFNKSGESGNLVLECWITPFDFAPYEGPETAVVSSLTENKIIGMSWSILEYDDNDNRYRGFYNLSHKTTMYGNASDLVAFRLMPLDDRFLKPVQADWTFEVIDLDERLVAFRDRSHGNITSWTWEIGEDTGEKEPAQVTVSHERNPIHRFSSPGEKTVKLTVAGPDGTDTFVRVWDVVVR